MHLFCVVEKLHKLLKLEATYGTPSQYSSVINQLIIYYKQVTMSDLYSDHMIGNHAPILIESLMD